MDTTKLQKNIMLRVYGIWFLRRVLPVVIFELLFIALAINLFAESVFVAHVIENAAGVIKGNPVELFSFLWSAFWNARLEVKLEVATALLMGVLFLWSIKRAIVSYEIIRRK
jgi:hypothetical protein